MQSHYGACGIKLANNVFSVASAPMIISSAWQILSSDNAVFPIDMQMQVGSGSAQCSEAGPTLPARGWAPGRAPLAHAQDAAPGAHVDGAAPGAACARGCGALSPQCRLDRVPQALLAVYLQNVISGIQTMLAMKDICTTIWFAASQAAVHNMCKTTTRKMNQYPCHTKAAPAPGSGDRKRLCSTAACACSSTMGCCIDFVF